MPAVLMGVLAWASCADEEVDPPPTSTPTATAGSGGVGTGTGQGGDGAQGGQGTGGEPVEAVVVYYNNFEQDPLGSDGYQASWSYCQANPDVSIHQDAGDANPTKVFRARFPEGTYSLNDDYGFRCDADFAVAYDELYLSYRIKFAPGFDAVLGGKLPRIEAGRGAAGTCPDGTDTFTGGMMFKKDVDPFPVFYIYHPEQWNAPWYRDQYYGATGSYPTSCDDVMAELGAVYGTTFPWQRPSYSCVWDAEGCFTGSAATLTPGQWYTITERIVANTPGQHDGFAEGYIDGWMAAQVTGLRYRDVASLALDWIDFTGFFGGGDPSWATTKDEIIDYDDVIAFYYESSSGQPTGHELRDPAVPLPPLAYPAESVLLEPR